MKIAFVAKGGSGKSTISALFLRYLETRKHTYLCVDADINVHMKDILGVHIPKEKGLSYGENPRTIKAYLQGENPRIASPSQIVKTTPPSRWSQFLYLKSENELMNAFAVPVQEHGYLMHVGTYEEEGIGESCYHSNLSVFEALVSHTITNEQHIFVADMTAGTDSFAGALHAQFDLVCLVVEPTKESVSLAKDYLYLAEKGGVKDFLGVVGNKIEDEDDRTYIENVLSVPLLAEVPYIKSLKTLRRQDLSIFDLDHQEVDHGFFDGVFAQAQENMAKADDRLVLLHELHKKHAAADYIVARHGDLSEQIDPAFSYHDMLYEE